MSANAYNIFHGVITHRCTTSDAINFLGRSVHGFQSSVSGSTVSL